MQSEERWAKKDKREKEIKKKNGHRSWYLAPDEEKLYLMRLRQKKGPRQHR